MPQIEITTDEADAPDLAAMISSFGHLRFTEKTVRRLLILRETTFSIVGEEPHLSRFLAEYEAWKLDRFQRDAW